MEATQTVENPCVRGDGGNLLANAALFRLVPKNKKPRSPLLGGGASNSVYEELLRDRRRRGVFLRSLLADLFAVLLRGLDVRLGVGGGSRARGGRRSGLVGSEHRHGSDRECDGDKIHFHFLFSPSRVVARSQLHHAAPRSETR